MPDTLIALIDAQARVLNTLRTWGSVRAGMRASHLLDSADAEVSTLVALTELDLIESFDTNGTRVRVRADSTATISRSSMFRIRLTAKGKGWVTSPPNMLLREIDLAGRTGLPLRRAMEIATDSRIIRWAVDEEGYATLHTQDTGAELHGFTRQGAEFLVPQHFVLRPTYKIRKRVGS